MEIKSINVLCYVSVKYLLDSVQKAHVLGHKRLKIRQSCHLSRKVVLNNASSPYAVRRSTYSSKSETETIYSIFTDIVGAGGVTLGNTQRFTSSQLPTATQCLREGCGGGGGGGGVEN